MLFDEWYGMPLSVNDDIVSSNVTLTTLAAARLGLVKFGEPLVRDFESLALPALILVQLGIMETV